MSEPAAVIAARAQAEVARARLLGTAHVLQERLKPATIAGEVWERLRERGESSADKARRAIEERPVVAGSVALAFALFLARRPIVRLIGRLRRPHPTPPVAVRRTARPRNGE